MFLHLHIFPLCVVNASTAGIRASHSTLIGGWRVIMNIFMLDPAQTYDERGGPAYKQR